MSLSNDPAELLTQYKDAISARDAADIALSNAERDIGTVKTQLAKAILPDDADPGRAYSTWIGGTYVSASFTGVNFFVTSKSDVKTMLDVEIAQREAYAEQAAVEAAQPVSDDPPVNPSPSGDTVG